MASQNGNRTQETKAEHLALGSHIFLPDGTVRFVGGLPEAKHIGRHLPFLENSANRNQGPQTHASISTLESGLLPDGSTFDWIREEGPNGGLKVATCHNGIISIHDGIEYAGQLLSPDSLPVGWLRCVRFPRHVEPYGNSRQLQRELAGQIQANLELSEDSCRLLAYFVLATWFCELLPVAPCVSIFGPIASGKTTLLRVLSALSYRPLCVTDISSAGLYQLVDSVHPTLLIDEFESGGCRSKNDLHRLLRASFTAGGYVARFGKQYNLYGPKILCSELPLTDDALRSRCLEIGMLPVQSPKKRVDASKVEELANVFQPELMMFRLSQFQALKEKRASIRIPSSLGPRMADIFLALALPIRDDEEMVRDLGQLLEVRDSVAREDRELEPQRLVAELLFSLCHEWKFTITGLQGISEIHVGGIAEAVQEVVNFRGGREIYGARRVGAILKSLGLRTIRLGRMGRGFRFSLLFQKQVHDLAAKFEITRKDIESAAAECTGYGGRPCKLCDKHNLGGGLKFVEIGPPKRCNKVRVPNRRRPLFGKSNSLVDLYSRGAKALLNRDQP
jgi:hypothetical protein